MSVITANLDDLGLSLDVRLPDGNGLNLCRRLRHDLPVVQCIILTGAMPQIPAAELAASGAAAYVRKEDPLEDLLSTIHDVASYAGGGS